MRSAAGCADTRAEMQRERNSAAARGDADMVVVVGDAVNEALALAAAAQQQQCLLLVRRRVVAHDPLRRSV
jgi:hypothetical protein